jgi:copper(I)-binding protein
VNLSIYERGKMKFKKLAAALAAFVAVFALSACSSSENEVAIAMSEPVVRAIDEISFINAETGKAMTGSFMTLTNSSDEDVTLVSGSSPVAGIVEIHEVVDGVMRAAEAGLTIPANGNVELRMGGWHVMLMELNQALNAGDEVDMTLEFSNGETLTFKAPVKAIAMDDEKYGAKGGM